MLSLDRFWKQLHVTLAERRENSVEHAAKIIIGIIDDPARVGVPQHRHGYSSVVVWFRGAIRFAQILEAIDWITGVSRSVAKRPAALVAEGIDDGDADGRFQSL